MSPDFTEKLIPETALKLPYLFARLLTSIIYFLALHYSAIFRGIMVNYAAFFF